MRTVLTIILAILFSPIVAAQVVWNETEHDFGAVNEDDGKVSTEFSFVNKSNETLYINHVRSSCGCTVPEYSKSAVNPGDTASIKVVYNPTGRPGRFSKSLTVKLTNDSTEKLLIKGIVIGAMNTLRSRYPVEVGPIRLRGNMLTFGAVKAGKMKSQFIEVYNTSHQPIVAKWSDVPKYLRVTAASDTVRPGEQGFYSMAFTPDRSTPYGILTDSLTLNVPGESPVKVEIAAIVEEDFSRLTEKQLADAPIVGVDTDMLDFGEFTTADQPLIRRLRVTNNGKDELIFRRLHIAEPGFAIKSSSSKLKKGKSCTITVTFNPVGFRETLLNTRLQIITNDPSKPLTTVRLVGIPREQ